MNIISYLIILLYFASKVNTKEEEDIFEVNKNKRFCGVDLMKYEIKNPPISKPLKSNLTRQLATVYTPIRIYLESTYFEYQGEEYPIMKDKILILKEALIEAINGIKNLLEVEQDSDNIFSWIDPSFFEYYKVYKWNSIFENGSDIKSDFLIIVKIDNINELPNGVLASALPISFHPLTNRPIVGLLTLSNNPNVYNYGRVKEYFSQVYLHELTHALGFLYTMFPYYPGGLEKTITKYVRRGIERNLIITPKVLEVAKKYFNCSNIIGVELEDQGGDGSSGSHWEQRILLGDYMGAVIYQEEIAISEITLALLEDSSWYKVNYYTGGLMRFGKNRGCNFLENLCLNSNYETEFDNEFFNYNDSFIQSCSTGRQSRTYSFLNSYDYVLDSKYVFNFIKKYDNSYHSGAVYTTDYCPTHGYNMSESPYYYFFGNCKLGTGSYGYNIFYYNYEKQSYESNHPNMGLPKELGEKYSNTSFCIMSSLAPIGINKMYSSVLHPMCYQVHCSSSFLTIQINDDYIVCPRQGGNVELKGYDGKLHCPDYNLICTGTVICNNIFDCIEKKSLVKDDTFYYNYKSLTTQRYLKIYNGETFTGYELSNDGVCPIYCSQCSKNKKCKKCLSGYNLVGVNKDDDNPIICDNKINVEKGYYKNEDDDTYYLCSNECETCKEKNNKCIVCKENYYFLENSASCYNKDNYPNGYYFNKEKKIFMACHANCKTCSEGPISDNKMNCDTCNDYYSYDKNEKNCYLKENNNVLLWILIPLIIIIVIIIIIVGIIICLKKRNAYKSSLNLEMTSKNNIIN